MTRWVTEVCEFPKIKQGACGSSEEWTWMSKVPDGVLSKKMLSMIDGQKTADPNISCDLRRPTLASDYCSLEPPLSATIRRPKADGERRSLCKLQTKIGTFQIWKRKLLAGEFAYYLDHWSESYSWFLCSKYEWAKAEAVANLKVDRWGGKQSVRLSKSLGIVRKGEKICTHSKWREGYLVLAPLTKAMVIYLYKE